MSVENTNTEWPCDALPDWDVELPEWDVDLPEWDVDLPENWS